MNLRQHKAICYTGRKTPGESRPVDNRSCVSIRRLSGLLVVTSAMGEQAANKEEENDVDGDNDNTVIMIMVEVTIILAVIHIVVIKET